MLLDKNEKIILNIDRFNSGKEKIAELVNADKDKVDELIEEDQYEDE